MIVNSYSRNRRAFVYYFLCKIVTIPLQKKRMKWRVGETDVQSLFLAVVEKSS